MTRFLSAVAAAVLLTGPAVAQKNLVKIDAGTRIGLPAGPIRGEQDDAGSAASVAKRNTWAPLYLRLQIGDRPFSSPAQADAYLHVEGQDGDGLGLDYRIALGNLFDRQPGTSIEPGEFPHMPYVRPTRGELLLTVKSADGSRLSESVRLNPSVSDPALFVVLSLGTKLTTFSLTEPNAPSGPTYGGRRGLRNGRVLTAACVDPLELPDHWFGYAAADVVVLPTGGTKTPVLDALFGDAAADPKYRVRRDALFEWVRRGGKLVVSVGTNADKLTQYPLLQEFLAASVTPAEPKLSLARMQLPPLPPQMLRPLLEPKKATDRIAVANFRVAPDRGARVVLDWANPENPARGRVPVVVQWPDGLGRVTAVAFDLDRSPFADCVHKSEFWDWLLRNAGNTQTFLGSESAKSGGAWDFDRGEDKFVEALRTDAETFDGVPVISFGWVALFIVLYTLLIGPVEYFFLKRVLKRLELTWITFPLIVITVSAVAYVTAYAIKGKDLRLNKFDVVDVDVANKRVYGRTWVSVFSPRVEYYGVGIGPNEGWVPASDTAGQPDPLVDWTAGGTAAGDSLWGGRYSYHVDAPNHAFADGLNELPIQVWSVKVVEANWSYRTGPLVESRLVHPPGAPDALAGDFVTRLPLGRWTNPEEPDPAKRTYALTDAVALYRGKVYRVGTVLPNTPVRILAVPAEEDSQWFQQNSKLSAVTALTEKNAYSSDASPLYAGTGNVSLWATLFHEFALGKVGGNLSNATLRPLDQSWRIDPAHVDEVILLAKVGPETGPTESVLTRPHSASPTLLWLKGHPRDGKKREPIPGTLYQETYVRIFLPVKKAPK